MPYRRAGRDREGLGDSSRGQGGVGRPMRRARRGRETVPKGGEGSRDTVQETGGV